MSSQTYSTWKNATVLAGSSDGRSVRQVATFLNINSYDTLPFCALFGGTEAYEKDGGYYTREVQGKIRSQQIMGMKPELYDHEVAPNSFRQTADTAAVSNGDSVAISLVNTNGLQANDVLKKYDQDITMRITAVNSTTQATVKIISGAAGVALTKDDNVARIMKVGSAYSDGSTIGNGVSQEPVNRYNNLQFHIKPFSMGLIQKEIEIYGNGGSSNYDTLKKLTAMDFQRDREMAFLFGQMASEGTAGQDGYITYSGGLTDLAESVYANPAADGTLTEDEFLRGLMPAMRQGGDSVEVYALCGTDVMTTLSGYSRSKMQTKSGDDKYASNIRTYETPSGILKLIPTAMLDTDATRGTLIGFQPKLLTRYFLKGMDVQFRENLNIGNVLKDVSAYMTVEALLASNPKAITIATNILK